MTYSRILYSAADRRATITLDRAEKRNAFDDVMVKELTAAMTSAAKDPAVRVVILNAQGPAFCAGADMAYITRMMKFDLEENRADSFRLANLLRLIYETRKPVIAVVNGAALGGGCGIASACDFVIASEEKARFGYPEVHIGFVPAVVLPFLVKRVGEGRARELVLRGNVIGAGEAKQAGLVSVVAPEADLVATVDALVNELITTNSGVAMGVCKEMLSKLHGLNLVDSLDFAANVNAAARMTADCKQGMTGFLNKQPTSW